jgi:hypothetical protein
MWKAGRLDRGWGMGESGTQGIRKRESAGGNCEEGKNEKGGRNLELRESGKGNREED